MTDERVSLSRSELQYALENAYHRGWVSGRDAGKTQAAIEAERYRTAKIEADVVAEEVIGLASRARPAAAPTEERT